MTIMKNIAKHKCFKKKSGAVIYIKPTDGWIPVDLGELYSYRELLYNFILRDLKVRYKQTLLGASWAIIQPLFLMIIFTLFFGKFAKIPSDGIPYPLFSYAALLPWTLFAEGITRSTNSMIQNSGIMTKVYFPRMILPLSGITSPLVDFAVAFGVLVILMIYYGFVPTMNIIWLPAFILLALMTSLGIGLWLSALNVQYRDFQYVIPFLIQIWLFASPVVYPASLLPESYQLFYGLNPMAGVIEGFRWALLGMNPPSSMILVSTLIVIILNISGAFYFKRTEKIFADVV